MARRTKPKRRTTRKPATPPGVAMELGQPMQFEVPREPSRDGELTLRIRLNVQPLRAGDRFIVAAFETPPVSRE